MATMASKVLLPSHSQPFHENFSILSSFMKWSTTQKPMPSQEEDNQSTASQNRVAVESSEKKELSAALVASDGGYSSNQIKPWNLRSSRKDQDHTSASAPVQAQLPSQESAQLELGLGFDAEKKTMEKRKRSSFLIALTKEEIEADILAITGSKPMARPKKRPKNVQRQLDNLFPGLCLKSITPNSCKVRDAV
ncbi:hypothetical protein EZV62_009563 [Acer yangbiense]|uniref:DUF1639 domain-containing protein n=1 Tax=Acer yangbiense TaxID=1000413 RepID=A0A5C7I0M8_9ROSI|nr:hypothetical protein EZV62_009563 [Acer yangbiense]